MYVPIQCDEKLWAKTKKFQIKFASRFCFCLGAYFSRSTNEKLQCHIIKYEKVNKIWCVDMRKKCECDEKISSCHQYMICARFFRIYQKGKLFYLYIAFVVFSGMKRTSVGWTFCWKRACLYFLERKKYQFIVTIFSNWSVEWQFDPFLNNSQRKTNHWIISNPHHNDESPMKYSIGCKSILIFNEIKHFPFINIDICIKNVVEVNK